MSFSLTMLLENLFRSFHWGILKHFFAARQNLSVVIKFLVSGLRIYWDFYRRKYKAGHAVFLGENKVPDDFKCIWENPLKTAPSWHAENLAP